MNNHTLIRMVVFGAVLCASHSYAQNQYTEEQKKNTIERLSSQTHSYQQHEVDKMDNYNKNVFKATQSLYGGYKNVEVNVQDYENDPSLTEAQRNSIRNHHQRAALIKQLVAGQ